MTDYILDTVHRLQKKLRTKDPFEAARNLGIHVLYRNLNNLKGFYTLRCRERYIVINESLSQNEQKIVCAHELGHALLHKDWAADHSIHDISLFDMTAKPECEANLFASELLLPDSEVLSRLEEGEPFFQVASELYVPPELLDFKFRMLRNKGYQLDAPMVSHGDFLKK